MLILPQFLPATCEQRALQLLEKAPLPPNRDAGADSWRISLLGITVRYGSGTHSHCRSDQLDMRTRHRLLLKDTETQVRLKQKGS